jgi:hypothetical protein
MHSIANVVLIEFCISSKVNVAPLKPIPFSLRTKMAARYAMVKIFVR